LVLTAYAMIFSVAMKTVYFSFYPRNNPRMNAIAIIREILSPKIRTKTATIKKMDFIRISLISFYPLVTKSYW